MSDAGANWHDIISSIGTIVAMITACFAIYRSSKQKQNDQLKSIEDQLTQHILDDEHSITELQTNVKNLTDNVNSKLDTIIRELDK
jgi:gas vesicle protein